MSKFAGRPQHERNNLKSKTAFKETISFFPPDAELVFYLAQPFVVLKDGADAAGTPTIFSVTAAYEYEGRQVSEVTTIDMNPYRDTAVLTEPVAVELEEVRKAIEKGFKTLTKG